MANPSAITDVTTLRSAAASYLLQVDVDATDINLFISLAEAEMNKDLKLALMTKEQTGTLTPQERKFPLPSDFIEIVAFRLDRDPSITLEGVSPERFYNLATISASGLPRARALIGTDLHLAPAPDAAYDYELWYIAEIPPLTDSEPTNALLSQEPLMYLAATLTQANSFVGDDAEEARWHTVYEKARNAAHARDMRSRYRATGRMRSDRQGDRRWRFA